MQFKTRILFAAGCAGLLAMNIPAFGAPLSQRHEHQRNIQNKKIAQPAHAKPRVAHDNRGARLVSMPVTAEPKRPVFGWPLLVREARRYIGTNPTHRSRLWCATFMNMVLAKAGYTGTNSDAAKSFTSYGHRISEPQVGAIAVLSRGNRGGHVGVVSGVDPHGNPIIISGNHGHSVGEGIYPRSRVIAYVMPSDRRPVSDVRVAERAMPNPPVAINRAPSKPNQPQAGPAIDSPISELLAAIEAEQNRREAVTRPIQPAEPPIPHLVVQQMPERPLPAEQQIERRPPAAQPDPRDWRRVQSSVRLPGAAARASVPRLAPQRPLSAQQRRHVANADDRR